MREQVGQFTRRLTFGRAYDLGQRFGIQSMIMQFALTGPLGAVNWSISTNWWLEAQRRQSADMYSRYPFDVIELVAPRATGIGYHARVAQYPDQTPCEGCQLLDGGTCYYDGSSLWAEKWVEGFLAGGEEWLWLRLEDYYRQRYENGPEVDLTPEYLQVDERGRALPASWNVPGG